MQPHTDSHTTKFYFLRIVDILHNQKYHRVVLQIPKSMLRQSFHLQQLLQQQYQQIAFYVLYDSLKNACCIDSIGAQHVDYDCLVHFGKACLSEPYQKHHYYIFEKPEEGKVEWLWTYLHSEQFRTEVEKNEIGYIMADQSIYGKVKQFMQEEKGEKESQVEMLRFIWDREHKDQYLVFGYYQSSNKPKGRVLIITQGQQSDLIDNMLLLKDSLSTVKTDQLYSLKLDKEEPSMTLIEPTSKKLMQRMHLISQLPQQECFGIVASTATTQFCSFAIKQCQKILAANGKKCFTFLMNNLNEPKLGNFAEIDAYVIVSCFNFSLYTAKEFHRLVVAPIDLEVAFGGREILNYNFDLRCQTKQQETKPIPEEKQSQQGKQETQVLKNQSKEMMLSNTIQTLDHYRERQYKGLDFGEKKEIKKISKGKIGLAEQYQPLE